MKKVFVLIFVPLLLIIALYLGRNWLAQKFPTWGGKVKSFFDGLRTGQSSGSSNAKSNLEPVLSGSAEKPRDLTKEEKEAIVKEHAANADGELPPSGSIGGKRQR